MHQRFSPTRILPTALALAAASLLCAQPAVAQTRAALVQSIDEPGRNAYQETQSNTTCRGTTSCVFNFAAVPAGKRLVVTHIAGYVDTGAGTLPSGFLQSSFGGAQYATVPFTGVRGPTTTTLGTRILVNHQVLAYFGAGDSPRGLYHINFTGDTMTGGALMMISGHYVNLP